MNHRIIITGGPGAGKSSLLEGLANNGHHGIPEVSRKLIRQEVAAKSDKLPWLDLPAFAGLCLSAMLDDYHRAQGTVFYDRGIPDIIGYLKAAGLSPTRCQITAARRYVYSPTVFIAPPWKEIYRQDQERWQSFDEAVLLYRHIRGVYVSLGYRLIELPLLPVMDRVSFIEREIQCWPNLAEEILSRP